MYSGWAMQQYGKKASDKWKVKNEQTHKESDDIENKVATEEAIQEYVLDNR